MVEPTPKESRSERDRRERGVGYRMFAIGYTSASEAGAGLLLGAGVDWVFGCGPWGLVIGGIAGVGVAMWSLVRRSLKLQATLSDVADPTRSKAGSDGQ